jgi:hypothetical protein
MAKLKASFAYTWPVPHSKPETVANIIRPVLPMDELNSEHCWPYDVNSFTIGKTTYRIVASTDVIF